MRRTYLFFLVLITGGILGSFVFSQRPVKADPIHTPSCNNGSSKHSSLALSQVGVLRKLAEYETVCQGAVVDRLMFFTAMPKSEDEARLFATEVTRTLQLFSYHHIIPLVVFEPSLEAINIGDFKRGPYDSALTTYFTTLKTLGITSEMMGTWVLFPEANTPTWHNTNPTDFVANVIKVGTIQKQIFPESQISLLLNSRTYYSDDSNWDYGELKSLKPYVNGLPQGLIDSFGLQGFPSIAPANALFFYQQTEAKDFLPAPLAIEATNLLGTSHIWLNTGSFSRAYTQNIHTEVRVQSSDRRQVLESILNEVGILTERGFDVSVNLFNEDKSQTTEQVNWSYWPHGQANTSPDTSMFIWFVDKLRSSHVGFSLYDHPPQVLPSATALQSAQLH